MSDYQSAISSVVIALHKVFGEAVTYTPKGGEVVVTKGIRTSTPAEGQGFSGAPRASATRVTFDLPTTDVAVKPASDDHIAASDGDWFVRSVPDTPTDGVWRVVVEKPRR